MKKFTIIGVLLLAVVGYLVARDVETPDTTADETLTKKGEIVEIDLEQMKLDGPALITMLDQAGDLATIAVPSMGIRLCAAFDAIANVSTAAVGDKVEVSGSVDSEGNIVPCVSDDHYLRITGFVGSAEYGYEFAYRKGPDGYVVEDKDVTDTEFLAGVTLLNTADYEAFTESVVPTEGPTAMQVRIYKNDNQLDALTWVRSKPLDSNIQLAIAEPKDVTVGGVIATFYTVDGLYTIDTYVIAHGEYIYLLTGSYFDKESAIYNDFQSLVSSFTFTSTSAGIPQGKINPQIICESALAYMTFASGADADLFVEACVNGEHPEVIERYMKDNGLDGATI